MNAAFAIAYLCEDEEQMHKISYMKESLDLVGSKLWKLLLIFF